MGSSCSMPCEMSVTLPWPAAKRGSPGPGLASCVYITERKSASEMETRFFEDKRFLSHNQPQYIQAFLRRDYDCRFRLQRYDVPMTLDEDIFQFILQYDAVPTHYYHVQD
ncbi:hypothetical protein CEXT_565201 [Caerostris extrusa]|uniref:Uncharacterized protein n=1 Tax=Caerostris extrusa TaxID=172846 RepID=A0AAV4N3P7_CAEEX|nr:hypothetical protein CEXT_565201 [Caerostris extrusa]